MWDLPIEKANTLYFWAYIALIFGAMVTAGATITLFWTSAVRERHATQEIAEAQVTAAMANERAATLEKEAADARLEQERLRKQMAWRRLSSEQRDMLIEALQGQTFDVWVTTVRDDPEARLFHQEIYEALKDAGLDVHWFSGYAMALGLTINDKGGPANEILTQAFRAIGFPLGPKIGDGMKDDRIEITVGSKPPPF